MLLGLMRKHAKSWLIKFVIAIIAIVFIFYFGYSFSSKEGVIIAFVNGEPISGVQYQKTYRSMLEALQKEYKAVWSDNLIKVFDLKNKAINNLINQRLLSMEAKRIGLDVTEEEIQDEIISYPAFQFKGRFDENRYRLLLQRNHMKPEDFEADIAQDMLQKKLMQFLTTFIPVTDQEIWDYYYYNHRKVKISFIKFSPEKFKESISEDKAGKKKYFDENKEKYRIPEKIKIAYITIDPEKFRDKQLLTDEKINNYYEDKIGMFKQKEQVRARHILFKLEEAASKEDEKRVKEKALSALKEAQEGKDFADLAKKHSEGPTGKDGGDLGYFFRGQMVKPFEEAAFKMKKGEISAPVRTSFGYHIIKIEDKKTARIKPLAEVRDQIKKLIIESEGIDLAHEKALSLIDQMPYDVDLGQFAETHNMAIKRSNFFSRDDEISDIGGGMKFKKSLFSLQKDEVSELLESQEKFFIIQVVGKKPSYLPEMKEISKKVEEDFTAILLIREAKAAAEKYLMQLKGGKDWEKFAKEKRLTPENTDFFSRNEPSPKIGYDQNMLEAAFILNKNRLYPDKVFENEMGVFVIKWEGKEGIDKVKYEEEKKKYRYSLMQIKYQDIYSDWLKSLNGKADIEIISPL